MARSDSTMTTASTSGEDSIDAGVPPPPEPIYVAMNNNNIKSESVEIANREEVEKHPCLAAKEVGGIDDIYAASHFDSRDGRTQSLLRLAVIIFPCS